MSKFTTKNTVNQNDMPLFDIIDIWDLLCLLLRAFSLSRDSKLQPRESYINICVLFRDENVNVTKLSEKIR